MLAYWHGAYCSCFFFFQAEDGIRDYKVTGVQTCALPIFGRAYFPPWSPPSPPSPPSLTAAVGPDWPACPASYQTISACQLPALAAETKRSRSEEHTSELQSPCNLVCRLLLEKKETTAAHP